MKIRTHMRYALIVALCWAAILAAGVRAQAAIEYCPARAQVDPIGISAPSDGSPLPSSLYSLVLSGLSSRTVSGTLVMHTENGWYTLPFTNVVLTQYQEQWQDQYVRFTTPLFLSPVFYLRFSQPVTVSGWFVSEASTSGEVVFGWDAKGKVTCASGRDISVVAFGAKASTSTRVSRGDLHWLNPLPTSSAAPPSDTPMLTPALTSAPGSTDCAVPFADAVVTKAIAPSFPPASRGENGETFVQVAVSADGHLDDAWVWGPSGDKLLDAAALEAAQDSKYAPARAFCQDVPGMYFFRVQFHSP